MLRRLKQSKPFVGKKAALRNTINSAMGVSASAPVLGDLLKRFAGGDQDRQQSHLYQSHDDDDDEYVFKPPDKQQAGDEDEEVG